MNGTNHVPLPRQPAPEGLPHKALRRIREAFAEMNFAQRRAMELRLSFDRQITDPGQAPDTYQEFLLRTSGPLRREPSARRRLAGRRIR